jgi:CBS domain-containing protein
LIETLPQGVKPDILTVSDIMSTHLATARIDEDVFSMIETMKTYGVSRLPLVDEHGSLCGIVTAKNLFQILSHGLNDLANLAERRRKTEQEIRH